VAYCKILSEFIWVNERNHKNAHSQYTVQELRSEQESSLICKNRCNKKVLKASVQKKILTSNYRQDFKPQHDTCSQSLQNACETNEKISKLKLFT
jgi:hypothetical protein